MTTFVLVPGMWLGAWAWHDVTVRLRAAGHDVYPLTLTGIADRLHVGGPQTDLDTHTTDITALIEAEELTDVVLAGHSYGGSPVTAAADRIPDRIRHVVYVDSGPLPDGTSQLDTNDDEGRAAIRAQVGDGWQVPPRVWAELDPPMRAGLSPETLAMIQRRATPHPYGSIAQPLALTGAGDKLPRTLIASTFPVDVVRSMIADGHPYFAGLAEATLVGLPTGHWPMFSEPAKLADALAAI
ncbi:MAG: esterase [Actinobacteria bacterium 13_2_20CM_2_71_6]|nr:MAG: esterase [Actinobacteria bacterium 13_2_20CM_2_71_6]